MLVDAMLVNAMLVDAMLVDAMPVDAMPVDAMLVDATLADAMLVDATLADAMLVDAMPVDAMGAIESIGFKRCGQLRFSLEFIRMDIKELAEKLAKYPNLKQRIEEMLAFAENSHQEIILANAGVIVFIALSSLG
jgi:pentapeptide MXKDX repeat protein